MAGREAARHSCIAERTRRISSRSHTPDLSRPACASILTKVHSWASRSRPSQECSSDTFVIMVGPFGHHVQLQELASIIWRRWPTLVQEMGALPCAQDLAHELGAPVSAVQQARLASEGYTASSIDSAMSRGVCFAPQRQKRTSTGPKPDSSSIERLHSWTSPNAG